MVAILILRNGISRFVGRPRAVQRSARAAIVALAATIALAMSPPAFAGLAATDASSDPLKAAEAFSARELYTGYLLPLVVGNADQEPQYRPIERAGHEGGDMVFVRQAH